MVKINADSIKEQMVILGITTRDLADIGSKILGKSVSTTRFYDDWHRGYANHKSLKVYNAAGITDYIIREHSNEQKESFVKNDAAALSANDDAKDIPFEDGAETAKEVLPKSKRKLAPKSEDIKRKTLSPKIEDEELLRFITEKAAQDNVSKTAVVINSIRMCMTEKSNKTEENVDRLKIDKAISLIDSINQKTDDLSEVLADITIDDRDKKDRENSGNTQGKKGCRMERINMRFTTSNYEYIRAMSRICGKTMREFVNDLIAADHEKHSLEYIDACKLLNEMEKQMSIQTAGGDK